MARRVSRPSRVFARQSFLLLLLAVFLAPASLLAQLGAGQMEGTVTDPSGAVVVGAKITVTNVSTGVANELATDSGGRYRAVSLGPGPYTVKVQAAGFATLERKGIDVVVGQTATVDLKLQVARAGETVVVEDAAPLVQTESTQVASVVSKDVVQNVPAIGRRWDNYVLLAPGVSTDGTFGLISYRGVSGLYNNNTVDGLDNNQAFFSEARGRTRAVYTYSQAAVQEFQVGLSNFNAEYGRAAGGLVNAVTKSGGNKFHGEAFYFIRDSSVGAADPFAAPTALIITGDPKLPERRQQYGFAMGGPIKKEKLFWFLNYDEQHRVFPYVVSTSSATFPVQVSTDCTNVALFPTPPTPQMFNQRATCQWMQSQLTVVDRKGLNNVALGKLDWILNQKHNLSVSYNYHDWRGVNGIRTPLINFNAESDNGFDGVRDDSLYGRWNYIISPRVLNEFRFQFAKDNELQRPNAPGPSTTVTGAFSFGQPDFLPRPQYPFEKRFQWTDNLSWVRGRHTFKFGADINYVRETQINLFQGGGVYSYSTFANLAGDCPAGAVPLGCVSDAVDNFGTYTQAFDLRVMAGDLPPEQAGSFFFTTKDWNFYAQDTFKVRSNLTLNLGVRYEYQQLPQPETGNPLLPLSQHFKQDTNNFAPRVGISWDIDGNAKTVLRAGYGLIYGRTSNSAIVQGLINNGVIVRTLSFTPGTAAAAGLTYPNCFMPGVSGTTCTVATPAGAGLPPDVSQFAADFVRPLVHQAEVSLEHELFKDTVLSLTYAYSGGRRLPYYRDVNLFPPASEVMIFLQNDLVANGQTLAPVGIYGPFPFYCTPSTTASFFCPDATPADTLTRPDPNFRRIMQAESVVNSSYNALIVQVRRRMRRGILVDGHFTWSKAIDNGQNSTTFFGRSTTIYDPLNPSLDRSRSDFDIRKRLVATFVWRPDETFSIKGDTARKIFGRWQLSGAFTAQDGKTANGTASGFLTTANTRPVDTGSSNGTGGNFRVPFLGRNFGQAPGLAIFDMRVSKSIPITEGTRLEFIAESFNLFNRRNITTVNNTAMSLCTAPPAPVVFPPLPPPNCPSIRNPASPPTGLAIPSNYIVNNSNAGTTDNNCGGTVFPDGTRCLILSSATDYLAPRSASSTHNGMRDVQFAVKFHW